MEAAEEKLATFIQTGDKRYPKVTEKKIQGIIHRYLPFCLSQNRLGRQSIRQI